MPLTNTAPPSLKKAKVSNAAKKASSGKVAGYEDGLNALGGMAVFGLTMAKQYADAAAVSMHGPNVFHELAVLADQNEKVASVLSYLTEAGPYAGILTASMPLVLQILANHGRVDASRMPPELVTPPAVLESQVMAEMAQQRAAMAAQQTQAQQTLEDVERERQFYSENTAHGAYEPSPNGAPE